MTPRLTAMLAAFALTAGGCCWHHHCRPCDAPTPVIVPAPPPAACPAPVPPGPAPAPPPTAAPVVPSSRGGPPV